RWRWRCWARCCWSARYSGPTCCSGQGGGHEPALAGMAAPLVVAGRARAGLAALAPVASRAPERALATAVTGSIPSGTAQGRQRTLQQAALVGTRPGLAAGRAGAARPQLAACRAEQPEARRPPGGFARTDATDARHGWP